MKFTEPKNYIYKHLDDDVRVINKSIKTFQKEILGAIPDNMKNRFYEQGVEFADIKFQDVFTNRFASYSSHQGLYKREGVYRLHLADGVFIVTT